MRLPGTKRFIPKGFELGQYAAFTTALVIGSESNGPKKNNQSAMDPNPKNNRAAF